MISMIILRPFSIQKMEKILRNTIVSTYTAINMCENTFQHFNPELPLANLKRSKNTV